MSKVDYSAIGKEKAKRNAKGQFVKGASGNPSGHHSGYYNWKRMCRGYCPEALEKVVSIMRGECDVKLVTKENGEIDFNLVKTMAPGPNTQLSAAQFLIEQGHGKATQSAKEEGRRGKELSPEEKAEAFRLMKRRIREFEEENGELQEH